jgi:putative transposase
VAHATLNRWVITSSPPREEACHRRKRPVWIRGRLGETDSRVPGAGRSRSRAVDTHGQTVDGLRTGPREEPAARRFLTKAIRRHGVPETIPIDGRDAKAAALKGDHQEHGTSMEIRQIKYLNPLIAQDHRGGKRVTRPLVGCKGCEAAPSPLVGIALMPMLRTGQLADGVDQGLTAAEPFYALAS